MQAVRSSNQVEPTTTMPDRGLYPSYKSFDNLIDIERLRSLDGYIAERIRRHITQKDDSLFLNQHCLDAEAPYRPGVREIWLKRTARNRPYDYLDLDRTELWAYTGEAAEFAELTAFVETLPFAATGRILLIYDNGGRSVPAHRDHEERDVCHEFIWLRTNLRKPFYLLNEISEEKLFVRGYSAWFDTVNQYHGSDGAEGLNFSLRVDGRFSDDLRSRIPFQPDNAASTPAVWASMDGDAG